MATSAELGTEAVPDEPAPRSPSRTRSLVEWVVVIVGAVVVATLIKTFLIQAFFIPSPSMEPTLGEGDRVLVNKLAADGVGRGDVVVFERIDGEASEIPDLIKRIVAVGGDTVVIDGGRVWVNGSPLDEPYLPEGTITSPGPGTSAQPATCAADDPCIIPEGSIWVMGDNRGNSRDSRWFGPVPADRVVGRAFVVVWPVSEWGGL